MYLLSVIWHTSTRTHRITSTGTAAKKQQQILIQTQYSDAIFCLYLHAFTDVSWKRHVSLQNRYRYIVRNYDKEHYVKTFFFRRPAVLIFRAHLRF